MTQRDRARLERVLARRRQDLERWTTPVIYHAEVGELAPVIDRIRERLEKAERARREVRELEAKLNGGYKP